MNRKLKDHIFGIVGSGENLEKLLYLKLQSEGPVRQEPTYCLDCRRPVDVRKPGVKIRLRELDLGGHTFTMLDPHCPECGRLLKVRHYVVH